MKSVFDVRVRNGPNRLGYLVRARARFLARAQITWITWPAFVMLSIIVYDDWVPLWTRIHSIHQFSSVQFSSVQCVRLFVVHSSPVPIQISFRPSATTKCINNRQTNFTFITKERILYICSYRYICMCMFGIYLEICRNLCPLVCFHFCCLLRDSLFWIEMEDGASVNIEATFIVAQCTVGWHTYKFCFINIPILLLSLFKVAHNWSPD